jgi:hypothetical protein
MSVPDVLRDPHDPYGRAKIGVKISAEARREPPPLRDSLFMTYADDLRMGWQDAESSIRFHQEQIDRYKSGDPATIRIEVERCFGAGTTIAQAVEREQASIEQAKEMLAEIEVAPTDHEEDLCHVLNVAPSGDHKYYPQALTRFVGLYGDDSTHIQWLIARAATQAEMRFDRRGQGHWGEDGRWRAGDARTPIAVDAADHTIINRGEISTLEQMVEASLAAAMKVAAVVKFHDLKGNEGPRAYWQHWLDRELSTLSQTSGIDYELEVAEGDLPSSATIRRWEAEINVLDSEDQAKLRYWEAVCHYWYCDEGADADAEDAKWAEHVEGEAEETRRWAQEKRERVIPRPRSHCGLLFSLARRRFGARSRQSRGRSVRCRGSRRVTSRSTGGGSSGDDPDPEPSARVGAYGLGEDRTLWDIAVTSFGALIGDGVMGSEGMLVGGVVAYLWGCCRWHRRATRMRRG